MQPIKIEDISVIERLLSNPQIVLIFAALVAYISYLVKTGWVSFTSSKLKIGKQESERVGAEHEQVVMRRQVEYIDQKINACMRHIPRHEKFDEWRTRFIFEKVIDAMVNWCMFNHIGIEETYVRLKQEEVWNIVQKYTWHESYQTAEFRHYVNEVVLDVITTLVSIRREYGTGKHDYGKGAKA